MTPALFLGVALAGGAGSAMRFLVDRGVQRALRGRFPWGVFVINLTGSFLLGLLTGALPSALLLLGVGFLGGYTTFSTAALDTVLLWREGGRWQALAHGAGMLILAVAAAGGGIALGHSLAG